MRTIITEHSCKEIDSLKQSLKQVLRIAKEELDAIDYLNVQDIIIDASTSVEKIRIINSDLRQEAEKFAEEADRLEYELENMRDSLDEARLDVRRLALGGLYG